MTREISCQEAAQYVYRYLDGELEPRTRTELLFHLEACQHCVGVVEFERRMLDFVRVRAAAERPPAGLHDRVRRILETGDGGSSNGGDPSNGRGAPGAGDGGEAASGGSTGTEER